MYLELRTESQLRDFFAEFGATKESVKQDVEYLIEWMEKQPHLPNIRDEEWLTNVLLRCKNGLERAKKRLEYYFTNKAMFPEIFQNRDTKGIREELKMFAFFPCPKLTPDGHRIMIWKMMDPNTNELPSGDSMIRGMQIIFDFSLKVDQVRGVTLVYDSQNIPMTLVSTILPVLSKYILIQHKINPIRYNKVYILNLPSYVQPVVKVCCSVLKKESEKLVMWKKESSKLSEVLPKECLPEEYGGTDKSVKELTNQCYDAIEDYQPWFREQEKLIADLAKKSHSITNDGVYGIEGSFRKLCVD